MHQEQPVIEREFDLGDILTITHDRLLSPRGMAGVDDILQYMAEEPVWMHQIPRVSDEAKKVLFRRYPELQQLSAEEVDRDNWKPWLDAAISRFGERLAVPRMSEDEHERIDPISELAEKVHPSKIIPVIAKDK